MAGGSPSTTPQPPTAASAEPGTDLPRRVSKWQDPKFRWTTLGVTGILLIATFAGVAFLKLDKPPQQYLEVYIMDQSSLDAFEVCVAGVYVGQDYLPLDVEHGVFNLLNYHDGQALRLAKGHVNQGNHQSISVVFCGARAELAGTTVDVLLPKKMLKIVMPDALTLGASDSGALRFHVNLPGSLHLTGQGYVFYPLVDKLWYADFESDSGDAPPDLSHNGFAEDAFAPGAGTGPVDSPTDDLDESTPPEWSSTPEPPESCEVECGGGANGNQSNPSNTYYSQLCQPNTTYTETNPVCFVLQNQDAIQGNPQAFIASYVAAKVKQASSAGSGHLENEVESAVNEATSNPTAPVASATSSAASAVASASAAVSSEASTLLGNPSSASPENSGGNQGGPDSQSNGDGANLENQGGSGGDVFGLQQQLSDLQGAPNALLGAATSLNPPTLDEILAAGLATTSQGPTLCLSSTEIAWLNDLLNTYGALVLYYLYSTCAVAIYMDDAGLEELRQSEYFQYVEPILDGDLHSLGTAKLVTQWAAMNTAPNPLREYQGTGVGIAVIDTGIDATHQDLLFTGPTQTNMLGPVHHNFKVLGTGAYLPTVNGDVSGHGTSVAGLAAGRPTNLNTAEPTQGGFAANAALYGISIGDINTLFAAQGLDLVLTLVQLDQQAYAATGKHPLGPPIRVVNAAWGVGAFDPLAAKNCIQGTVVNAACVVRTASSASTNTGSLYATGDGGPFDPRAVIAQQVLRLDALGVSVVFAAGNGGGNPLTGAATSYQCAIATVICVAGADDHGQSDRRQATLAAFSSRGYVNDCRTWPWISAPAVDLVAPIPVASLSNGVATQLPYSRVSGTSFAAPLVAATIALMLDANPNLTPGEIRDILKWTAAAMPPAVGYASQGEPACVGRDPGVGAGLLDVQAAVQEAANRL